MEELACGNCGGAPHRLRAMAAQLAGYVTIEAVCCGCGSVCRIEQTPPRMVIRWGDESRGQKADGVLTEMAWPKDDP